MTILLRTHVPSLFNLSCTSCSTIITTTTTIKPVPRTVYYRCLSNNASNASLSKFTEIKYLRLSQYVNSHGFSEIMRVSSSSSSSPRMCSMILRHIYIDSKSLDKSDDMLILKQLFISLCNQRDVQYIDDVMITIRTLSWNLINNNYYDYIYEIASAALGIHPRGAVREVLMSIGGGFGISMHQIDLMRSHRNLDIKNLSKSQRESLMMRCVCDGDDKSVQMLVDAGFCEFSISLINTVLLSNSLSILNIMISHGAHLQSSSWQYVRSVAAAGIVLEQIFDTSDAIRYCLYSNQFEIVRYLIDTVKLAVPRDAVVMVMTTESVDLDFIDYLLYKGADINARDIHGRSVLHISPLYARYFIYRGIDVYAVDDSDNTLVHALVLHAISSYSPISDKCSGTVYIDALSCLLSNGTSAHSVNIHGQRAVEIALKSTVKCHVLDKLIEYLNYI